MKKFLLLSIGLLFFSYCTIAQNNNVYKYYKNVNRAELARISFKNKKASKHYERAFKYKKPFEKDAWQYMWVYANRHFGKESIALQCAKYNAQREMLWTAAFKKDSIFYKNITNIKDTSSSTIIPELRDSLDSILKRDQQVRISDTIPTEQIILTDSLNMQKLGELFETYGHIDEDNAGDKAFHIIEVIFLHYCKTQTEEPPFFILENAVRAGTFDVRSYIYVYDICQYFRNNIFHPSDTIRRNSRFGTDLNQHSIVGDMLFIYPPENMKKVNANRKAILMAETWKDYEKKLIYAANHGGAGFVQVSPIVQSLEDEEQQKKELMDEIDSGKVKGKYMKIERFSY